MFLQWRKISEITTLWNCVRENFCHFQKLCCAVATWFSFDLTKNSSNWILQPVAAQTPKYWWGSRGVHFLRLIFIAFLGDLRKRSLIVIWKYWWGLSLTGLTVSAAPDCNLIIDLLWFDLTEKFLEVVGPL